MPALLMLSAFVGELSRWTHQHDFLVPIAFSCRDDPDALDLIGFFSYVLSLRMQLCDGEDFRLHRTKEVDTPAMEDVSFSIREGEFVSILGASGSGKSTLLYILGVLDNPTSGVAQNIARELSLVTRISEVITRVDLPRIFSVKVDKGELQYTLRELRAYV